MTSTRMLAAIAAISLFLTAVGISVTFVAMRLVALFLTVGIVAVQ